MSDTSPLTDDEIDLFALWETLRDQWLIWVGAALAGLLMALGASQLMTPQYEATLLVRVGQVSGQPVEQLSIVIERLKSKAFLSQVCHDCASPELAAWSKRLTVSQPKNADVISLVVKASSAAAASADSERVLAALQAAHADLARPAETELRRQLAEAEQSLKALRTQRRAVLGQLATRQGSAAQAALAVLQLAEMGSQQEESALVRQVTELRQALTPPRTRPTERIQPVFTGSEPVSPKVPLMAVLGTLAGGFLGVLGVFLRQAWRNRRETLSP